MGVRDVQVSASVENDSRRWRTGRTSTNWPIARLIACIAYGWLISWAVHPTCMPREHHDAISITINGIAGIFLARVLWAWLQREQSGIWGMYVLACVLAGPVWLVLGWIGSLLRAP